MKKAILITLLSVTSLLVLAQEPGNNLGKTLSQIKSEFPDVWKSDQTTNGGGDLWLLFDDDQFHEYTYYFDIRDGRVYSEAMCVDSTGALDNAGYFFFITTVQKFYNKGGWIQCNVDNSILRAASIFRSEHRLVWARTYEADFEYSDFCIYFQYNQKQGYSFITYYPK